MTPLFWASLCTYLCATSALAVVMLGDPEDSGSRLGRAVYWLCDLPDAILSSRPSRWVLGEGGVARVRRACRYVLDEPNPIMQTVYMLLVCGGYGAMVGVGYPRLPTRSLPSWHRWTGLACFAGTLASFCAASIVAPGYIVDEATAAYRERYPYDGVLFAPGRVCPTTRTRKVARSKFCAVRRLCVARFDHFCPWVNAAIGEDNYRWFLLFLTSNLTLLAYGALASAGLLADHVASLDLWHATFVEANTGATLEATPWILARYLINRERTLCALLVVSTVMGALVAGFCFFHLWLLYKGQTTNEHYKWRAIAVDYRKDRQPLPRNVYDRGLVANVAEVLWPLSHRRHPPSPETWGTQSPAAAPPKTQLPSSEQPAAAVRRRKRPEPPAT